MSAKMKCTSCGWTGDPVEDCPNCGGTHCSLCRRLHPCENGDKIGIWATLGFCLVIWAVAIMVVLEFWW